MTVSGESFSFLRLDNRLSLLYFFIQFWKRKYIYLNISFISSSVFIMNENKMCSATTHALFFIPQGCSSHETARIIY